eukprot:4702437-Amphidinium_carterae.1
MVRRSDFEVGSALVIASDGLWDVLPREGVGAKARASEPKVSCAQHQHCAPSPPERFHGTKRQTNTKMHGKCLSK